MANDWRKAQIVYTRDFVSTPTTLTSPSESWTSSLPTTSTLTVNKSSISDCANICAIKYLLFLCCCCCCCCYIVCFCFCRCCYRCSIPLSPFQAGRGQWPRIVNENLLSVRLVILLLQPQHKPICQHCSLLPSMHK